MDLNELVGATRGDVAAGVDVPTTLRLVRQFIMDASDRVVFERVTAEEPASTGDERWDALISGVIEELALRYGSVVRPWKTCDRQGRHRRPVGADGTGR